MHVRIRHGACCGNGECVEIAPAVFALDSKNKAVVLDSEAASPELLVEAGQGSFYFAPAKGGGLWEWDCLPRGVNFCSVISRYPEAYHGGDDAEAFTAAEGDAVDAGRSQRVVDGHRVGATSGEESERGERDD